MSETPTPETASEAAMPTMACNDMAEIRHHLDRALAVYGRAEKLLTAPEIRTKILLSTVRSEAERLRVAASGGETSRRRKT